MNSQAVMCVPQNLESLSSMEGKDTSDQCSELYLYPVQKVRKWVFNPVVAIVLQFARTWFKSRKFLVYSAGADSHLEADKYNFWIKNLFSEMAGWSSAIRLQEGGMKNGGNKKVQRYSGQFG